MRFQFIADHPAEFAVRQMCTTLNVSPSGYYAWRKRPPSAREMANQALVKDIETVYNDNDYLSPEVYEQRYYQHLELSLTPCPQN